MAVKEIYYGSVGPIDYDDADVYPDTSDTLEGARLPQVWLEEDAVEDYHAVRLSQISGFITGGADHVADSTGTGDIVAQFNTLLSRLEGLGILKTS